MPTYSYGVDSIMKIVLTEDEAAAFNRVLKAFYEAQYPEWNPETDAIFVHASAEDLDLYNDVASRLTRLLETIDQDLTPIEILDDYLVRN